MNKEELVKVIESHGKWLKYEEGGIRADLQDANLQEADLHGVDLQNTDLRWVDLREADLRRANLQGANLDFSCLPLHCNSFGMVVDDRLVLQLFAHIVRLDTRFCSEGVKEIVRNLSELAKNGFIKYHEEVEKIYR